MTNLTGRIFGSRTRRRQDPPPGVALLGSPLACLSRLRTAASVQVFSNLHAVSGRHRGAVIGVDTAGIAGKRELRQVLRDTEIQCAVLCGRLPRLEHIVIVVDGPTGVPDDALHRICDAAARRIAERLEDAVKEVAVTVILADSCDDPDLLADRVLARLRQRQLFAEAVTVPWREIITTPIAA